MTMEEYANSKELQRKFHIILEEQLEGKIFRKLDTTILTGQAIVSNLLEIHYFNNIKI